MNSYRQFIFDSYEFDATTKSLLLHYAIDDALRFTEAYTFDFDFAEYDPAVLDRALQIVFFVAGVSYYKTFVPPEIVVKAGDIDRQTAAFLDTTYRRGLGEFWYVNKLDPRTPVSFPTTSNDTLPTLTHAGSGILVGVGGGKDSLVSIELLRDKADITTWSLNHRPQLTPLVERIGLHHLWVGRTWDPQLIELKEQGAYNGHVPISAIFAAVGSVVAVLSGKRDVVVSNEQSANEPTLTYDGVSINHQYSKSQQFERAYQDWLGQNFGDSLRYYSLLRPFSELRIAEIFSHIGFEKYRDVFSSCNRAYTHASEHMSWCGKCSKCAFTFLALTPFVPRESVEALWGGRNLLLDAELEPTFRQLLGIEADKPLDCVGEIKESRSAMRLAQQLYPSLQDVYVFELPDDYSYRAEGSDQLPEDVRHFLRPAPALPV